MMESLEQIKSRIESAVAGAKVDIVPNASPSQQSSLLIDNEHAREIAKILRDDPALRFDFCSNATGVDWLDRVVTKKVKVKKIIEGAEKEVEETQQENRRQDVGAAAKKAFQRFSECGVGVATNIRPPAVQGRTDGSLVQTCRITLQQDARPRREGLSGIPRS